MAPQPASARIYTLADSNYFVGLVALFNSLRLSGNLQELVVLDCGLSKQHCDLLRDHVTIVPLPPEVAKRKFLAKPYLHQFVSPEELVVYIDSDIVVTAPLEPILTTAARGRICMAPVDWPEKRGRSVAEWQQLFELTAPIREQTYVNAGFFALSAERWGPLLERWWHTCSSIPDGTLFRGEIDTNPLWAGDQDAFNALLMSEVPAGAVELLPEKAVVFPPDLERIDVLDLGRLECAIDGEAVVMLHYSWVPKPWEPRAWRRMQRPLRDAYTRMLPRILFADDVALALDRRDVPAWLRTGAVGAAARRGTAVARPLRRLGARAVRSLPASARERLMAVRDSFEPRPRG